MGTTTSIQLSNRDRALLRAVAAGRCILFGQSEKSLMIDGYRCTDQFAGSRLAAAGLINAAGPTPAPARLTPAGQSLLQAA